MYFTEDKEKVESYLKEAEKSFAWHGDDLAVWYTLPAMKKHKRTGKDTAIISTNHWDMVIIISTILSSTLLLPLLLLLSLLLSLSILILSSF